MNCNLKNHNVSDLSFFTVVSLDQETLSQIRKIAPPDEDGDNLFLDTYKIDNVDYRAIAWIIKQARSKDKYVIHFAYQQGKGGRLPKNTPYIHKFINIMPFDNKELCFHCRALFRFSKKLKVRSIISLPLKLVELNDLDYSAQSILLEIGKKDFMGLR